jgi:hypothetical protein
MRRHTLKRILGTLERGKSHQFYCLSEGGQVLSSSLHLLQAVPNAIRLMDDLEDLKAH